MVLGQRMLLTLLTHLPPTHRLFNKELLCINSPQPVCSERMGEICLWSESSNLCLLRAFMCTLSFHTYMCAGNKGE